MPIPLPCCFEVGCFYGEYSGTIPNLDKAQAAGYESEPFTSPGLLDGCKIRPKWTAMVIFICGKITASAT